MQIFLTRLFYLCLLSLYALLPQSGFAQGKSHLSTASASLDSRTGIFSGITQPDPPTADNTILIRPPEPLYTPNTYNLLRQQNIAPITPTNSGSVPLIWRISPDLPPGLVLSSTGVISGRPTAVSASTSYTVTAKNNIGEGTTQLTLAVSEPVPAPNYNPDSYVFTRGTPIDAIYAGNTGGVANIWEISRALPDGLQFNTGTGTITGTPTTISAKSSYTITASNASGRAATSLNIQINDIKPAPVYTPNPMQLNVGAAITATPGNSGGPATTWRIDRPLPTGLNFNTTTGVISGTPAQASAMSNYVISAGNTSGEGSFTLRLGVNPPAPQITCPTVTLTQGEYASVACSNSGGPVSAWSLPNTLPEGMSFSNGVLSGTPAAPGYFVLSVSAVYGDKASSALMIVTINPPPPRISCANATLTTGRPAQHSCVNSGGPATEWQIVSGSLNPGLTFAAGTISGTPTMAYANALTIRARNAGGDSSATMQLSVITRPPEISCPTTLQFDGYNQVAVPFIASVSNASSPVENWQFSPALPTSLDVQKTGNSLQISGRMASWNGDREYTLFGANAAGGGFCQFTINGPIPVLNCPAVLNIDRNNTINPVFTVTSNVLAGFRSGDLSLPYGVTETRTPTSTSLSGTVRGPWSTGYYSYIAWNTFGEAMCRFYVGFENNPPQSLSPLLNRFGIVQIVTEDAPETLNCNQDGVAKRRNIHHAIDFDGEYDSFTLEGPTQPGEIIASEVEEVLCDGSVRQSSKKNGVRGTWILKLQRGKISSVYTFTQ